MANYDSIDLDWSWDGDFAIDITGDLKDTSSDFLLSLVNEIATIVKSESLEWEKDITLGGNLGDFQGQPNVAAVGAAIEDRVSSSLVNQNIIQPGDVSVKVLPVHANQVLIMIRVAAEATSRNGLVPGEPVKINLVYDTSENSVFFLNHGV